jgi:hypothetical protein
MLILWLPIVFGYAISVRAQEDSESLTILGIDYESQFPTIEVALRYTGPEDEGEADFQVEVGGQSVNVQDVSSAPQSLAVAIVADLSVQMNDTGMPVNNTRFDDMQSVLQSFTTRLLLPDPLVSMTVFTETVSIYHPMSNDVGALTNIVNDRVDDMRFQPQQTPSTSDLYPLEGAVMAALEQLEDVPRGVPRELLILAAGNPAIELDQNRLQTAITAASDEESPLTLTVIAFGSDQAGEFDTAAADPVALEQLAADNEGAYFHYFDVNVNTDLRQDMERWFEQIMQRADRYMLRLTLPDEHLSGVQTVRVTAGGVADELQIELNDILPQVVVVVDSDSSSLQGKVNLSIHTIFTQAPIAEVEYLLGNRSLGTSEVGPDFPLEIDVYSAEFQDRFDTGEYELVAAVEDEQGQPNRSEPLQVTVVRPSAAAESAAGSNNLLSMSLMLGGGVILAGGIVGTMLWVRTRKKTPVVMEPAHFPIDDDISEAIDEEGPTEAIDDGATEAFNDEETQALDDLDDEQTVHRPRFLVKVVEGLPDMPPFPLGNHQTHYYIGRASTNGKRPDIELPHRKVSRSDHAKLVVLAQDGLVELTALSSQNGTFVGEDRLPLENHESVTLHHGDVFWISPVVKLRLEEE